MVCLETSHSSNYGPHSPLKHDGVDDTLQPMKPEVLSKKVSCFVLRHSFFFFSIDSKDIWGMRG